MVWPACVCNVAAGLIDAKSSGQFNLPFYTTFLYVLPALFIFVGNRVHVSDVADEFKRSNKRDYILTGICWGLLYLMILIAYSMEAVSLVTPLASLTVFSNLVVGYLWLKERDSMGKKTVAALLAILGVIFISL